MRTLALLAALALPAALVLPADSTPLAELQSAAGAQGEVVIRVPLGQPAGPNHLPRRLHGVSDGREAAAQYCNTAAFDSDKKECVQVVSRSFYFDPKALQVCRRVNFSSEVPGCAAAIADKTYLQAEADVCAREAFGSGIITCLQGSGRPTRGGNGDQYTRRQLRRIRQLLRDGRYRDAERELDELIDALDD